MNDYSSSRGWFGRLMWWLLLRLLILGAALGVIGAIAAVVAYFAITPRHFDYQAIQEANRLPGVTFLDADGKVLANRGAYHGDEIKLKDLPQYLPEAFIATEDKRFYRHLGIDPWGILRAAIVNLRAGHTVQGGSTITQQLAKNLFLSNDRTWSRKFKELFYAVWLERHMTKDQILSLYLNRIYFGAGTYGVDAAARYYFDKPASRVTLAEAAVLASLPKSPTKLAATAVPAPTTGQTSGTPEYCGKPGELERTLSFPRATQTRASHVLDNLVRARFMTEAQVFQARAEPARPTKQRELGSIQYYLDYVYAILPDILNQSREQEGEQGAPSLESQESEAPAGLGKEDLVVQTTIDTKLQRDAEHALILTLDCSGPLTKLNKDSPDPEGALVAIDPDGSVRAMVGGRDYTESQFNRATDAKRQPGSAFKPFVYLTALENGYTPDTIVEDAPIEPPIMTSEGPWSPTDYESDYKGRVTLRQALAESLNTAAVRISEAVGADKIIDTARRMGITSPLEPLHSIALGTQLVTPLELTGAYLPFARNGLSVPVHTVERVETKAGKLLFQYDPPEPIRVIEPQLATEMTNMMFSVVYEGTGRNASLGDRPAAGKTGTSSDWRDAWFVGYTSDLVAGVWVGNDDDSPMKHVTGGALPAQIWKSFMSSALHNKPITALAGAYPTRDVGTKMELKSFYGDLASNFRAVEQGASPGASPGAQSMPTDQPIAGAVPEAPCKRRFLGICVSR